MQRRAFLASVGLSTLTVSAGCLDSVRDAFAQPPRLGLVAVTNENSEPQRFQIQIERDGEQVHESTHHVEGKTERIIPGDVLECTWGDARGPYTLRGRVNETEWVEQSVADALTTYEENPDCVIAEAIYGRGTSENFVFGVHPNCESVPTYTGGCSFANSNS